jgi:hypothetical protein
MILDRKTIKGTMATLLCNFKKECNKCKAKEICDLTDDLYETIEYLYEKLDRIENEVSDIK